MQDNSNALKLLDKQLKDILSVGKFKLNDKIEEKTTTLNYDSEYGNFKIVREDNVLSLYCSNVEDPSEDDFEKKSSCLWDIDDDGFDEKSIKSVASEFSDAIETYFGFGKVDQSASKSGKKIAQKAKIKRKKQKGVQDYTPLDLAFRISNIYPEVKPELDKYIDEKNFFYAELFMKEQIVSRLKDSVKNNDQKTIKKLANTFNQYYEDGTNSTQSIIATTLLMFPLYNDKEAFSNISKLLDDSISDIVKAGIKRLNSPAGKKDLKKYENPKPYKEKKKSNLLNRLLDVNQMPKP